MERSERLKLKDRDFDLAFREKKKGCFINFVIYLIQKYHNGPLNGKCLYGSRWKS